MEISQNQQTLEGIRRGNEKILKGFYKNNLPYIRKFIITNSGTERDVEDIFQDALVLIYQKINNKSLSIDYTIQTYFYGICKNMWRNRLRRKQKKTTDHSIKYIEDDQPTILQEIEQTERERLYLNYFYKLSKSSQHVLKLFFEGKSTKEIASITGYTEGYVRKKKFESKKSLITMIEKDSVYNELKTVSKESSSSQKRKNFSLVS